MAKAKPSIHDPSAHKACTKCGVVKPVTEFYRCSPDPRYVNQNRYKSACKACKVREAVGWQQKNVEKRRAIHKRWAEANPDLVVESCAKYYRANKAKVRAASDRFMRQNPGIRSVYSSKRRALELGADGHFTAADVRHIYESQGGLCYYCQTPLNGKYHADHMTPLSRGGSNMPDNICCACESCNCRKNAKTAAEFVALLQRRQRAV